MALIKIKLKKETKVVKFEVSIKLQAVYVCVSTRVCKVIFVRDIPSSSRKGGNTMDRVAQDNGKPKCKGKGVRSKVGK